MQTEPDFTDSEQRRQKITSHFYKWIMFFIGLGTIMLGIATFLHYASRFDHPPLIWMVLIVFLGVTVIYFALKSVDTSNKVYVSMVLAGLNVFYFYGYLLLDTSRENYIAWLNVLCFLLVGCSLMMIFVTVLTPLPNGPRSTFRVILHILNLLVGIVVTGWSLLFGFGVLIFAGIDMLLLLPLGIVLLWALSYWIQQKMLLKQLWITSIFSLFTIALPVFIYYQYVS